VKIIVDANIVFSAMLNTESKIGDLLLNSGSFFDFIAPDFLRIEIRKHHSKLAKLLGSTVEEVQEVEFLIYKSITFISEEQIAQAHWVSAWKLVAEVDPKDVSYVAYAKHFRCKVWSGDKVLIKGLLKNNFTKIISADELFKLRQAKENN
jgi:predicted nucleic acid-binding protein